MAVTEPPWLNTGSGIAAANGTTSHTVSFGFTSTAGSLLVVVMFGAVTHTASGWTEQLQPVSSGELSVFTKTSAGDTSITATHNASNYAIEWLVYEFPAGSTYTAGNSSTPTSDTFPALTGLPGAAQVIVAGRGRVVSSSAATSGVTSWSAPWVNDADLFDAYVSGNDKGYLTVAHQINYTGTSITPSQATTYGGSWSVPDREHVVFALDVQGGSSTVNGTATAASTSTLTASANTVRAGAAALASTSTLTAAAATVRAGAATTASTSTLTAAASIVRPGVATLASTSSLTAAASIVRPGVATAASTSALAAAATVTVPAAAVLASTSTLTANTTSAVSGTAVLASTSTVTAAAATVTTGAAVLASTSTLTASASRLVPATALLVGASALTAAATLTVRGVATLASASALTAVIGNVNQPGNLTATVTGARLVATDSAARQTTSATAARLTPSAWP